MKKIISIAFALAALSVVLVGCNKEAETTTPDTSNTTTQPAGTQTPETTN